MKDDGGSILTIILIGFLVYGFWCGWKQLTQGSGFLGGHLPERAIIWLNQKKAGAIVVKIGISVVLAYIFAAFAIVGLIITIIGYISRD